MLQAFGKRFATPSQEETARRREVTWSAERERLITAAEHARAEAMERLRDAEQREEERERVLSVELGVLRQVACVAGTEACVRIAAVDGAGSAVEAAARSCTPNARYWSPCRSATRPLCRASSCSGRTSGCSQLWPTETSAPRCWSLRTLASRRARLWSKAWSSVSKQRGR